VPQLSADIPASLEVAREGSSRKRRSRSHPWAFSDLEARRDEFRRSGDIFSAPRLGWHFKRVITRAVNPPRPGTRFVDAAKAQSESTFADIDGSLVGLFRNSA
jgi:alpha-acetolactate decarboxylase